MSSCFDSFLYVMILRLGNSKLLFFLYFTSLTVKCEQLTNRDSKELGNCQSANDQKKNTSYREKKRHVRTCE